MWTSFAFYWMRKTVRSKRPNFYVNQCTNENSLLVVAATTEPIAQRTENTEELIAKFFQRNLYIFKKSSADVRTCPRLAHYYKLSQKEKYCDDSILDYDKRDGGVWLPKYKFKSVEDQDAAIDALYNGEPSNFLEENSESESEDDDYYYEDDDYFDEDDDSRRRRPRCPPGFKKGKNSLLWKKLVFFSYKGPTYMVQGDSKSEDSVMDFSFPEIDDAKHAADVAVYKESPLYKTLMDRVTTSYLISKARRESDKKIRREIPNLTSQRTIINSETGDYHAHLVDHFSKFVMAHNLNRVRFNELLVIGNSQLEGSRLSAAAETNHVSDPASLGTLLQKSERLTLYGCFFHLGFRVIQQMSILQKKKWHVFGGTVS
jgi:hypothetical protein